MEVTYLIYFSLAFAPVFELQDEAAKKECAQNLLEKKIPKFLSTSEALLKKSGGQYFVGDRVS